MLTLFAANAVLLVHATFIVFVAFGGLLVWRFPRVMWLQLAAVAWGAMIEFSGWICPLTPLENRLRRSAGGTGYSEGFVEHYVLALVYPAGLTRQWQIALGIGVLLLNALIYGFVLCRGPGRRSAIGTPRE